MGHAMKLRQFSVLLAGLAAGSAAFAQPTTRPLDEEPIVVTGRRDGGRVISVDFQRVARQCAECRRVLAEIEKLGAPYQIRKRQIGRDILTMEESIQIHTRGNERQAKRFEERMPEHFRKDWIDLYVMRRDVSRLVAAFLAQLEPHVVAAAEEERRAQGASAVVRMTRRAGAKRPLEVTDAIIRRVDARDLKIVLPGV